MKSNLIDIACEVRRETEKAVAVTDGTTHEWKGRTAERWFWLPKSEVEINTDGTVTMPEWLALDKGLI